LNSLHRRALAFVIRIWIEPREIDDGRLIWRGVAEFVQNPPQQPGPPEPDLPPARRGFTDLPTLFHFLTAHMIELGIPSDQLWPDDKPPT
jgi:hypothetical protein